MNESVATTEACTTLSEMHKFSFSKVKLQRCDINQAGICTKEDALLNMAIKYYSAFINNVKDVHLILLT